MSHIRPRLHHCRIQQPPPAVLFVEADSNRRAAAAGNHGGAISVREVDHAVEAAPPNLPQKPELRREPVPFNDQYFIEIRIPFQHVLGSAIHRHGQMRVRIPLAQGAQHRGRQQYVADIPKFNDEDVVHALIQFGPLVQFSPRGPLKPLGQFDPLVALSPL